MSSEENTQCATDKCDHSDCTENKSSKGKPVTAIVIGMAGSGKTTLMTKIGEHFSNLEDETEQESAYFINLDPAVSQSEELPYFSHIDIRDTVKYKEVMKQFGLGPNGGIVTALNLFATKFDQVLNFCEKRASTGELKNIFIDTPGQIEVFTWSASGAIITEALASTFPTCILYIVDTPRNLSPVTFMSNMMYACSIMFKTKLPFLLVFNKIDVASHKTIIEWINDFDVFSEALKTDDSYMSTLTRSMALVLEEFYQTLSYVGVSAATGEGLDDLFEAIEKTRGLYEKTYIPLLAKRRAQREVIERRAREDTMAKLEKDLQSTSEKEALAGQLHKTFGKKDSKSSNMSREPAGNLKSVIEYGEGACSDESENHNDEEEEEEEKSSLNFGEMSEALRQIQDDQ